MSRVNVTHFEACAFTGQTARPKSRNTTLVSNLRQRVVLVHKLGQLRRTEEFFNRSRYRLGVNQILWHQAFAFCHRQTLTHSTLNTYQTNTELVFSHFTDRTDTTVTQMVDIVNDAFTVADVDQGFHNSDNVALIQRAGTDDFFATDTTVELHAANRRQVVAFVTEKQVFEQRFGTFFCWWLTRTHHAVDFNQRFQSVAGRIGTQGVGHERTTVQFIGVNGFKLFDAGSSQFSQQLNSNFTVGCSQYFAALLVNDVFRHGFTQQVIHRYCQFLNVRFFQLTDMTGSNTASAFNDDVAVVIFDVERSRFTTQTRRDQLQHGTVFGQAVAVVFKEGGQDFFSGEAQSAQQN